MYICKHAAMEQQLRNGSIIKSGWIYPSPCNFCYYYIAQKGICDQSQSWEPHWEGSYWRRQFPENKRKTTFHWIINIHLKKQVPFQKNSYSYNIIPCSLTIYLQNLCKFSSMLQFLLLKCLVIAIRALW